MLYAFLLLASSLMAPASLETDPAVLQFSERSVAADSVFFLVSGETTCDVFDAFVDRTAGHPDLRELEGSDCIQGKRQMVAEFEFASADELAAWQILRKNRRLLAPLFENLKPLRIQIRAQPRDGAPCVSQPSACQAQGRSRSASSSL